MALERHSGYPLNAYTGTNDIVWDAPTFERLVQRIAEDCPHIPNSASAPKRRVRSLLISALAAVIILTLAGGYVFLGQSSPAEASIAAVPTSSVPTPTPDPCFGALPDFFDRIEPMAREWDDANTLAGQTSRISLAPQIATLQRLRRQAQYLEVPACAKAARQHLVDSMDWTVEGYLAFMGQKGDSTVSAAFKLASDELKAYHAELERLKGSPPPLPQGQQQG